MNERRMLLQCISSSKTGYFLLLPGGKNWLSIDPDRLIKHNLLHKPYA